MTITAIDLDRRLREVERELRQHWHLMPSPPADDAAGPDDTCEIERLREIIFQKERLCAQYKSQADAEWRLRCHNGDEMGKEIATLRAQLDELAALLRRMRIYVDYDAREGSASARKDLTMIDAAMAKGGP